MLERIAQSRLMSYFINKNVLSDFQFGFRSGYSTQEAIFELLYMHKSLNNDDIMGALFFDIS